MSRSNVGEVIVTAYLALVVAILAGGGGLLVHGFINPVPAFQIGPAIVHQLREVLGMVLVGMGALGVVYLWWSVFRTPRRKGTASC